MAVSQLARNLRDAELVLKDGTVPTAISVAVLFDEGDLTWTERQNTIEIKNRGKLEGGHLRSGEEESVTISFSAKWCQLYGKVINGADGLQLYEFLNFASGTNLVSTSPAGQQQTLTMEFTVRDPADLASEKVTFQKVYQESLSLSEGEDYNLIRFTGRAFVKRPVISRIS